MNNNQQQQKNRVLGLGFLLVFIFSISIIPAQACYTIIVGKKASADGFVLLGHNEDDGPPQIVNHYKVPRIKWSTGERVSLSNGGTLAQVPETWGYLWSEMPGLDFSDSYLNEWGVTVTSNNCPSREDQPELTDGGIGRMLRRLIAQRARTAREGVQLAGELVTRFGYTASGRTYSICDPDEGWLFCVINGKHWLAARVPDDQVAMIANTFSVHEVELSDTKNYLASPELLEYAQSRGWYDPARDGAFDFAAVYANPRVAADSGNFCRQWSGLQQVANETIKIETHLPFAIKPREKLDIGILKDIFRDHYVGTELEPPSAESGPHHGGPRTICTWTTQTSFIAQLRRKTPADIGFVYWVCLAPPCGSVYLPFHYGISRFPSGFVSPGGPPTEDFWRQTVAQPFTADPYQAFWTFTRLREIIDVNDDKLISTLRKRFDEIERQAVILQKPLEKTAAKLYRSDPEAAREVLTNYSRGLYLAALEAAEQAAGDN